MKIFSIGAEKRPFLGSLVEYEGLRCIDLRNWYFDKVTQTLKPTTKGVTLSKTKFFTLMDEIFENSEAIEEWFNSDTTRLISSSRVAKDDSLRKDGFILPDSELTIIFENLPNHQMFELQTKGADTILVINALSVLGIHILELIGPRKTITLSDVNKEFRISFLLMISFCKAINKISVEEEASITSLLSDLILEWNRKFKAVLK